MTTRGDPSIFISDAWKNDLFFVERLFNDLQQLGYDPRMDTKNIASRGRSSPREVQEQRLIRDRVVAVMGATAIISKGCAAERSFNRGKLVTPILRKGEYQILSHERPSISFRTSACPVPTGRELGTAAKPNRPRRSPRPVTLA